LTFITFSFTVRPQWFVTQVYENQNIILKRTSAAVLTCRYPLGRKIKKFEKLCSNQAATLRINWWLRAGAIIVLFRICTAVFDSTQYYTVHLFQCKKVSLQICYSQKWREWRLRTHYRFLC